MANKFLLSFFLLVGCVSGLPENNSILESTYVPDIQLPDEVVFNCPAGMNWVHGVFCTKVQQNCKTYLDPEDSKFSRRCAEFEPTICIGEKVSMSYCMDIEEYSEDHVLPKSDVSWSEAKNICESLGKRLCSEPEWTFACEGEESVPYATGLNRPSSICNMDIEKGTVCGNELCDHRVSIKENIDCLSPFKIHNMPGNVDEWIEVPLYHHSKADLTMRSSLKGGHWLPVRNRCRPRTDDHDEMYHQVSIGFRCCKDV